MNGASRARFKRFLRERNAFSEDGSETLLSVSEYYGVKPRAEAFDQDRQESRADSLVGYRIVRKGDFVMNYMLAWKGAYGISAYDGIVSPAYSVFSVDHTAIDLRFLHHRTRSKDMQAVFKQNSRGIMESRLRLYPENLLSIDLGLPTPEIQRAISTFLDRETTRIDTLIEKKSRFIELLKEKRATVISHAVTKGFNPAVPMKSSGEAWIGEVPSHWELKPLRAFFVFRNEKNDPVRTENILSLSIAHGVTPYSEEGRGGNKSKEDLTAYKIAHKGDIVLNSMNVIVGAVGRSLYFGAISPVYYALYPCKKGVYVPFFEKIFMNCGFQKSLLRYGKGILMKISGTGQMNTIRMKISQDDLKTVVFPVPPEAEQHEITEHIDAETSKIDFLITKTERSIELLKEKRAALITAAVTGKIDVRAAA